MKSKQKALKKMKKSIAEDIDNKNYVYTNGDSPMQAKIRKQPFPPGDARK